MHFDPALAARAALAEALATDELGDARDRVVETEEVFSSTTGATAAAAYDALLEIGTSHPTARAFQEFLIYITWQQLVEAMTPRYVERGLALCDRYLAMWGPDSQAAQQIQELQTSFSQAAGIATEEDDEYEQDTFKGGD